MGGTQQFTATVSGSSNQAVNWQVNGVTGGSASTGTISSAGRYTAPNTLPNANTAAIGAVSAADSSKRHWHEHRCAAERDPLDRLC